MGVLATLQPRADQPQTMPQAQASDTDDVKPGFFQGVAASFRAAQDVNGWHQAERVGGAYADIVGDVARASGKPVSAYLHSSMGDTGGAQQLYDAGAIWADVNAARRRDAKAFAALPASQSDFETQILTRGGAAQADAQTASRAGIVAGLLGGVGAAFTDPVNIVFGGAAGKLAGAGKTVAQQLLLEGLINSGIEAAQTPGNIAGRARMGQKTTAGDVATDLASAFAMGVAMPAAMRGLGKLGEMAYDRLPLDLRAGRALDRIDLPPMRGDEVAAAFEARVPDHLRTPDEAAALNVVRRAAEVDAVNPYEATYAGQDLHQARLEVATERLLTGAARDLTGWAKDARGQFKAMVRGAESGGNDAAVNPRSSATGRYQFTDATWVRMFKDRFGDTGQSRAEILGKRTDGAAQEAVMDHAIGRYEKALREADQPVTAANLYLEHFAGEGGAKKLLRAPGEASAESVLGAKAIEANPFLRDMTVDDVKAWAARKMGGKDAAMPMAAMDEGMAQADMARMDARVMDAEAGAMDMAAMAAREDGAPEPIMGGPDAGEPLPRLQGELFDTPEAHRAAQAVADADVLGRENLDPIPRISSNVGRDVQAEQNGLVQIGGERNLPSLNERQAATLKSLEGHHGLLGPRMRINVLKDEILKAEHTIERWGPIAEGKETQVNLADYKDEIAAYHTAKQRLVDLEMVREKAAELDARDQMRSTIATMFNSERQEMDAAIANGQMTREDAQAAVANAKKLADVGDVQGALNTLYDAQPDAPISSVKFDLAQPGADVGADPVGSAAQVQADGLLHDVRGDVDAGNLQGISFAIGEGGEAMSAAQALAKLEADQAALDALKGCL